MNSQATVRFTLLLGWCFFLSVAMIIMAIVIATETKSRSQQDEMGQISAFHGYPPTSTPVFEGPFFDQTSTNHVHLIRGDVKATWKHSPNCFCKNTSLLLEKDSFVKITVGGFYFIYAQAKIIKPKYESIIILSANDDIPTKQRRILSQVEQHDNVTVSLSTVIHLRKGETVKLNMMPESAVYSQQADKTYWGLFLLAKQKNN